MTERLRLSTRGRVVIPKRLRDKLAWTPGSKVEFVVERDGLMIRKVEQEPSHATP